MTFDEWYDDHEYGIAWSLDFINNFDELKAVVKMIWEESRQNMTTRDI